MYRKLGKGMDDGMLSEASFATATEADQGSCFSGNNDYQRAYRSDSGFESLDPVYEE